MTIATMMNFPLTTNHIVERAAKLYPDVEIVSQMADKSLLRHGYAEIHQRVRALAKALVDAGLNKEDRVATLMWNHHAHLEVYFGAPMAGGVYHTLNLRLSAQDLAYIANHAKDRVLIVDDVLLPLLETFEKDACFERVLVNNITGKPLPAGREDYEAFIGGGAPADWQGPALDENDAIGMCYTSGTTGRPKGVVYSHRAIVLHSFASAMADGLAISQHDTLLPVVPMFHANAWGLPFTAALVGCKQVHPGPHLDPESLLDLYANERVNVSAGVPTIWLGIQKAVEAQPDRWKLEPGLRMVVGGSAAPEGMIRKMDTLGMRVIHAWGMTETTPLGTISTVSRALADKNDEDLTYATRAKQGVPVPFVDIRAVGEHGVVPWDGRTMGELQCRGPWVAASYHDFPEAADKWTDDGWFRTGDVVTIDELGYVKIADRTKDLIKSGGEWISSVDMENALMGHPAIQEAAVIAIPDEKWGERPLAALVLAEGESVDDDTLDAYLRERFPKWWLPEGYVRMDGIPRTSTGKFLKAKLREQLSGWRSGE